MDYGLWTIEFSLAVCGMTRFAFIVPSYPRMYVCIIVLLYV